MKFYKTKVMNLQELQSFKVMRCDIVHESNLTASYFNCVYYHSREDKRRSSLTASKNSFAYSYSYIEDFYSSQMASNMIEYLYHPVIYKTIPCRNRFNANYSQGKEVDQCNNRYCPYLHEKDDVSCLSACRTLPLPNSMEEEYCQKIEQAEELQKLLKGDKNFIQNDCSQKIASFKQHLRELAAKQIQKVKPLVQPPPVVVPAPVAVPALLVSDAPKSEQNWYTAYDYFYYSQKLPIIEDRYHQFKNYRDIVNNNIAPTVMKYIAAFLNSDGGVLYVGIDDSSVVYGFEITQHQFDKFLLNVDAESKLNMLPPLMPHKYSIRKIPVLYSKKGKELWVVEVKVTPSEKDKKNKALILYNRQAYVRMNASTPKLDTVSIIEYIKHYQEERQQKKTSQDIMDQLLKSIDRKDRSISLQECQQLKEKMGKVAFKIEQMLADLKRKEESKI